MFSRPGAKDTEDDLLRLQEQFVTGRLNPAAAVVRSNTREESRSAGEKRDAPCAVQVTRDIVTLEGHPAVQPSSRLDSGFPPKKKSRFKTRNQETVKNKRQDDEEEMDCEALLDVHDRHVTSVLSQIQEKEICNRSIATPRVSERGFPMVLHRGNINEQNVSSKETGSQGRRSLFAQQFAASGAVTFGVPKHQKDNSQKKIEEVKVTQADSGQVKYSKPSLISGEGLTQSAEKKTLQEKAVDEIHKENVAKLEAMTHEEIMEEQTRIKSALDPNLVAFLTSRHKKARVEAMDTASKEEKQAGHQNTNISTGENIRHVGKHVHFSENIEMIKEENGQNIITVQDKQSSEVKKIGDVKVSSKWLHMDIVEYEKLEWMKDCPPPSALESKGGNQARFDFNGCLVSNMDDVPLYLGLHHHGKDPSSPGYTLEELCILVRSSFLQQRVLALQVLAKIIREYQMGAFQGHLDGDVLSVLLDAGTLFLLRWSLDDSTDAVMAAAIQGLAAILIVPSDKDLVNKMFGFPRGQELPALCPVRERKQQNKQVRKDKQEDEKNLTDAELLKQDVVKGLIQMSLLPRIRYVLEVCHPSVVAVHSILDILARISQHSTHAANEVLRCPRLMETIFANFLPLSWKMSELDSDAVYGVPSSAAMRLVRTVCCAGRHMAATLISKYNLSDRLMRYTALSPRNMQMERQEAYSLYTESLRTWRVCILYGLGCDAVREMYSTFIEHLQSIQSLSIWITTPEERSELNCAAAIFGIIEAAIHAAAAAADQQEPAEHHGMDSLPPLPINWGHVKGFLPLIGGCVTNWVKEILGCDHSLQDLQYENLCLLSGAFAGLAAFYSKLHDQVSHSPVETLQQFEQLTSTVLHPLIEHHVVDWCFTQISSRSAYNKTRGSKLCRKAIPSLPDLGSIELVNRGTELAESHRPELIAFTSCTIELMYHVTKLHRGITHKFSAVLSKKAVLEYLKLVVESQDVSLSFFVRQEHHLQYFLLKLASKLIEPLESDERASNDSLWHEAALSLFSKIFPGDEFYALDLLSTILLNSKFFGKVKRPPFMGVAKDLSEMTLATPPVPSTCDTSATSRGELIAEAHKNLPESRILKQEREHLFLQEGDVQEGDVSMALRQVRNIKSFLVPFCVGALQPADWMFLPIVDLYNLAISVEMRGESIDTISGSAVSIVTNTLQLVLLLEEWRPSCLRHVTMASRIARLICIFLTGNDLFLDSGVHNYLSALLKIYTSPSRLLHLDFNSPIPGLTSFYDLYASLLSQYSAVSFGDALFGSFVILPLAQKHDMKFRTAVWDEHVGVLRALSIPLDQLPIPVEQFLYPVEHNQLLLALYLRALATQTVRPRWSPLFYLVAVHHVNSFVFQRVDPEDSHELKKKVEFLKQVLGVQNESVRHDLLHYYKPATCSSLELFEKFANLPASRELLLRNRDDLKECRKIFQRMASA